MVRVVHVLANMVWVVHVNEVRQYTRAAGQFVTVTYLGRGCGGQKRRGTAVGVAGGVVPTCRWPWADDARRQESVRWAARSCVRPAPAVSKAKTPRAGAGPAQ